MSDINFCPYCEAAPHKLILCKDDLFYCKQCNNFFRFEALDVKCDRCKGKVEKSDFDSPSGGVVFFCNKCKKTYPLSEIIEQIK